MTITSPQLKNLHRLLNATSLIGRKHALVYQYSHERTESSKELLYQEAHTLIMHLEGLSKNPKTEQELKLLRMRRKMMSLAHEQDWRLPNGKGGYKVDMNRLNAWCVKYGQCKKELNTHSVKELAALLTQFSTAFKTYLKAI